FKGSMQNGKAVLNWATSQEASCKNFVIEKSSDGIFFSNIATISSTGTKTSGAKYSFTDNAFYNSAFYRLKQVDMDGHISVYNILDLKIGSSVLYSISLYNHSGSAGVIFYNGSQQQLAHIILTDLSGKHLSEYVLTVNQGNNQIGLPLTLAKGIYIVSIITEDRRRTSAKIAVPL
ncbi:MAG: T9SS type A sorting domain-containing protein, partial [Panacibacter sp.]